MYICIYVYMYICVYVYMCICIYVLMYICKYVLMYICICAHANVCWDIRLQALGFGVASHTCCSIDLRLTTSPPA